MLSLNLNHKEQNKKQAKAKAELLDQSLGCLTFAVKFQTKVPAGLIFSKALLEGLIFKGVLYWRVFCIMSFGGLHARAYFRNFLVINCYFIIAVTPEKSKDYSHLKFSFPP